MSTARERLSERLGPNATRVAVVATIGLGIVLVLILLSRSAAGTYELKAEFDNVRGLLPGGDVRSAAVTIGTVKDVYLNENDQPEVLMQIDEDYKVHEGAIANIRLASNVGAVNRTIDITEGDTSAPEIAEGTVLKGAQTDQPVDFDLAVETLNPKTRGHIRDFLIGLDSALRNRGKDFDRALQYSSDALNETASLLTQVNSDGAALKTLVREGERVTSALASSPGDLGEATERTATLLATTAGRQSELAESVRLLGPALARGRQALDRVAGAVPELRGLVSDLIPVVDELGPLARVLPLAAREAGPFFAETAKLVEQGPDLLRKLQPVIAEALPATRGLVDVVSAALPVASQLLVYAPETIGFFQNFGSTVGAYDANGHLVRVVAGLNQTLPPSTGSARINPSDCGPGLLEKPYIRVPGVNECEPWTNFEDSFVSPEK